MDSYVNFDFSIAKNKPNTLINSKQHCAFCDTEHFKNDNNVLSEKGPFIFIENKFRTFKDSFQTVLVENNSCEFDLSNYSKEHLYNLMTFTLENWFEMSNNPKFKSVVLIKNHGISSGASIRHPHMQIVGFEKIDYLKNIKEENFIGYPIIQGDVSVNLSKFPRSEFFEFNIQMKKNNWKENLSSFSDYIQSIVHYILNHLNNSKKSFNLLFYEFQGDIIVKIVPRFETSAFLIGYNIHQVPISFENIVEEFKRIYFPV